MAVWESAMRKVSVARMDAHKPLAAVDRFEQLGLALRRNYLARRVEGDRVVRPQVALDDLWVLAANHVEAVLPAELRENLLGVGQFSPVAIDHRMDEARTAGKVEQLGLLLLGGSHPGRCENSDADGRGDGFQQHFTALHKGISSRQQNPDHMALHACHYTLPPSLEQPFRARPSEADGIELGWHAPKGRSRKGGTL